MREIYKGFNEETIKKIIFKRRKLKWITLKS